jgi:allantoin racemase
VLAAPVIGLAEAAMRQAAHNGRFGIVTGGAEWQPILQQQAAAHGLGEALAEVATVSLTGDQLASDRRAALELLHAACAALLARAPVQSIVLGGAALAGLAAELAPRLPVPLIDSVDAGIQAAWRAAAGAAGARALWPVWWPPWSPAPAPG